MIAGLVMLAAFSAVPAFGNTITVTDTSDSGSGSLRDAIASASSGDTINFSVAGTITLSSTLSINTSLTISGPGASSLAISGNNAVEVFAVGAGITVTISGVTIENGSAYQHGGGILNSGTLSLREVTLSGNSVTSSYSAGGGIFNDNGGTLTVTNSTLSNNSASGYSSAGGAIFNYNSGTATVTNSTLSGNSGDSAGGGIYNVGMLTVTNSTFSGNSAPGYAGGGITNEGTLTVTKSTFSGNSSYYAGGILNDGSLTLTNSTLSGNSAGYVGGGIYNNGTLNLTNSTVSGNSAAYGGGITNFGTLTAKNSIVANSPSGGNCYAPRATFTSQGHNLSDDSTCSGSFNQIGDLNNTAAGLDPKGLQNNGGPTQTIALLATSPAVDAIPISPINYCTATDGVTPITTDQRGVTRPQGPACDIGAFELRQGQTSALTSNFNGTPIGGRDIVWFNSVLKVQGLGASPVNVYLTNATIQFVAGGTPYNLSVPNATITFSPTATSATTTFDTGSNTWLTTVPSSGLAGNTFLDALAFLVPGGGLPGGIKNVTWQGSFASDTPGITVDWKWAAAVYTSFGTDYNAEGVKPVDDNKASVYKNSDHAGTPENFKGSVIGGATGGGGSNFTGGYSGTQTIQF